MATHSSVLAWRIPGTGEPGGPTERLHYHFSLSCNGGGNRNPLQCSCLENPRDGGAWPGSGSPAPRVGITDAPKRTRLQAWNAHSKSHGDRNGGSGRCTQRRRHQGRGPRSGGRGNAPEVTEQPPPRLGSSRGSQGSRKGPGPGGREARRPLGCNPGGGASGSSPAGRVQAQAVTRCRSKLHSTSTDCGQTRQRRDCLGRGWVEITRNSSTFL